MGRPATVWVRVDADGTIGAGHAVRCGALLSALRPERVVVVGRVQPGLLDADAVVDPDADFGASRLGPPPDLILVDHPDDARRFLEHVGGRAALTVAIEDDGAELPADLVVRGVASARVSPAALVGSSHALVRSAFARAREGRTEARSGVVLAAGSGPHAAEWLVALVGSLAGRELAAHCDVVIGPTFADTVALAGAIERAGASLHVGIDASALAERLAHARVAAVTGGMLAMEALAAGAPTVLMPCDPAMQADADVLASRGAAHVLRASDGASVARFAIESLVADQSRAERLARAGAAEVDGGGAERVAREIRRRLLDRRAA